MTSTSQQIQYGAVLTHDNNQRRTALQIKGAHEHGEIVVDYRNKVVVVEDPEVSD